jgi:alcohol dehydrogenase
LLDASILRTFLAPRKTLFGYGAVDKISEEAKLLGGQRVLIVTDSTVEKIGLVDKVRKPLLDSGFETDTWNGVEPEPTLRVADVLTGVARAKDYDLVIGVGGGSSLDMAKVASLMNKNPGELTNYLSGSQLQRRGLPLIAIPTTSGTGSEATATLVVTHQDMKMGFTHPFGMPDIAVVDPELTISLPQKVTANTGLDALSHAVEAYMSLRSNVYADVYCLQSMELVAENLRLAFSQGNNREARYGMSMASMLGGLSIANSSVCGGHAMAYGFAVMKQLPHGFSCAMALPYIMKYNALAIPERVADVAQVLGEDTGGLNSREAADIAVEAVVKLNEDLGIPRSLGELGVPKEDVPRIADETMRITRSLLNNPRSISKVDAVRIFEDMWAGYI